MAKAFYKLPIRDIKLAINDLIKENILVTFENGYILKSDYAQLMNNEYVYSPSVFALHRNDFLVKSNEDWLKKIYKNPNYDILQYLLIDGEFSGAVMGNFKYGPYIIEDIVVDLSNEDKQNRKQEIIEAVYRVNSREGSSIKKYCGEDV